MTSPLSAEGRLIRLARSLTAHLAERYPVLLASERLADGAAALRRLAASPDLDGAIAELPPEEQEHLAELLHARWRRLGDVALEPVAVIEGPADVRVGDAVTEVTFTVQVDGLQPGWEASWEDGAPDGPTRTLWLGEDDIGDTILRARIVGRTESGRTLLRARHTIQVRRGLPDGDTVPRER